MKRRIIIEEHDGDTKSAPARQVAQMGMHGDNQLAHVNNYEAMLLKMLGGAGTRNPRTGLKQFYTMYDDNGNAITADSSGNLGGLAYDPKAAFMGLQAADAARNTGIPINLGSPLPVDTAPAFSGGTVPDTQVGFWKPKEPSWPSDGSLPAPNTTVAPPASIGSDPWNTQTPNAAMGTNDKLYTGGSPDWTGIPVDANGNALYSNNFVSTPDPMSPLTPQQPQTNYTQPVYNPTQGYNPAMSVPTSTQTAGGFDLPLNLAPYSTSGGTASGTSSGINTSNQGSYNTGTQGSSNIGLTSANNQSNNFSGLDQKSRDAILSAVIPQLTNATANMGQNYDQYTGNAVSTYQQMIDNAIKQQAPQLIGQLANRGILNSTEGENILAKMLTDTATAGSTKGYEAAMQAALAKANMPTILGQLAQLGQTSQGASTGTSSGINTGSSFGNTLGTSFGNSLGLNTSNNQSDNYSYQTDPTVMYRQMADLIKGMM
jgi:hypothetical protein